MPSAVTNRAEPADVVPYDDAWPATFASLAGRIAPTVADLDVTIEHVGSTAVPGLAAKPIIDMDVVVRAVDAVRPVIACMSSLGYEHEGDLGIVGREAFRQPAGLPAHHLYAVVVGSKSYLDHVLFRDYLRRHTSRAREYADRKQSIAHLLVDDRQSYVDAKAGPIHEILRQARSTARPE